MGISQTCRKHTESERNVGSSEWQSISNIRRSQLLTSSTAGILALFIPFVPATAQDRDLASPTFQSPVATLPTTAQPSDSTASAAPPLLRKLTLADAQRIAFQRNWDL